MKTNILTILFACFLSLGLFAQTSGFKYQAVVRNADGEIETNANINFKFSIAQGDAFTLVYSEEQSITTNDYGLVTLTVGEGTVLSGDFETIDWAADTHTLDVEVDLNDGNGYQLMGSSELLPVPYAMHAMTAENVNNDQVNDADADPTNEIQDLQLSGNVLSITGNADATEVDLSPFMGTNTDEQNLNLSGNTLSISNGNSVDLAPFMDDTDTQLSEAEVDAYVSNNGYLTAEADGDDTNEIQDLNLNGNILTITNNGTATEIDLSAYLDDTDTQLSEAEVDAYVSNNGYLTAEADGDDTNEIQDLSLNGDILTITNNGTATEIDLSAYLDDTDTQLSEAEVDAYVANNGYLTAEADGDDTNELQSLSLVGNTLSISDGNNVELDLSDSDWTINSTSLQSYRDTVKIGVNPSTDASLQVGAGTDANIHMGGNVNRYADIDFDYTMDDLVLSVYGYSSAVKFEFEGADAMVVSPYRVVVNTDFVLQDGTEGTGKVLTSDYTGNATWQELPEPELKYYSVDRMSFGDAVIESTIDDTYVKLKDVGTFTKVHEDTDVEIEFFGLLSAANLVGNFVKFQIRVDDNYTPTGLGEYNMLSHMADGNRYQENFTSFWNYLSAGEHTISIWVKTSLYGSAEDVSVNLGNFGAFFKITEYTND